ncbi:MAG: hypothetical protein ABIM24_09880, partial [Paraperlucidibaca sp.]
TLNDLALVLTELNNPATTNEELLTTVNNLLLNVTSLFSALPGSSTAVLPIQSAIASLTTGLSTITTPITQLLGLITALPGASALPGAALPTSWLPVLSSLIGGLTGSFTAVPVSTPTASTDALGAIPVIGPILSGLLGLLV